MGCGCWTTKSPASCVSGSEGLVSFHQIPMLRTEIGTF
jgi:hypothetical protein